MFHLYHTDISAIELPRQFTYPFCYQPHPLSVLAAQEVQQHLKKQYAWQEELAKGKMFGVLVVRNQQGVIGYLAAFSGILAGSNQHPFFVPPVYDLLQPQGFFKLEEKKISDINIQIKELVEQPGYQQALQELKEAQDTCKDQLEAAKQALKAAKQSRDEQRNAANGKLDASIEKKMIRESQFQKAEYKRLEKRWKQEIIEKQEAVKGYEQFINQLKQERKQRSATLQQQLFEQFDLLNAHGERRNLCDIFEETLQKTPPAGAGECAAPKLLQYAYLNNYHPLAMAEFWWGASPRTEIRIHGHYYPSCKGKCEPILGHMLQGLDVEKSPLHEKLEQSAHLTVDIIYEDEWIVAVNKPAGMLSVPGKETKTSVYQWMKEHYPEADGPLTVHRLDMDTSGILLMAKTKAVHQALQAAFHQQTIQKRYIALLEGQVDTEQGSIHLPLCPNILDRPRQMVSQELGKPAITTYQVLARQSQRTRIAFFPQTGRTHQLRVHAAHKQGLNCPIAGDALYGTPADRLYLHAEALVFTHPVTGQLIQLRAPAPF